MSVANGALDAFTSPFTGDSAYQGGPGDGHAVRHFICDMTYDGQWKDDAEHGKGSLKISDGSSYEGDWIDGCMTGEGAYRWASGSVYEGQWHEGMQQGHGKLMLCNGNSYEGEWQANERHGWGLYTVSAPTPAGMAVYEGEWVNGVRAGRGTTRGADGHVEVSRFENGTRVGKGARWVDPAKCRAWEQVGKCWRLKDGRAVEQIEPDAAEAIAEELNLPVPTFPFHP